jgi:8-oxo-dGTP pyrophosphatase MutT (NUDIX family)
MRYQSRISRYLQIIKNNNNNKTMTTKQPTRTHVVTVFLEYDRKILLLRRSLKVRTMQSLWGGISGYVEDKDPLSQAIKEVQEETGLSNEMVKLLCVGKPLEAVGSGKPDVIWIVHPFLFHSSTNLIRIDWEHDELRWINPIDIQSYETVPKLKEALENVYVC